MASCSICGNWGARPRAPADDGNRYCDSCWAQIALLLLDTEDLERLAAEAKARQAAQAGEASLDPQLEPKEERKG